MFQLIISLAKKKLVSENILGSEIPHHIFVKTIPLQHRNTYTTYTYLVDQVAGLTYLTNSELVMVLTNTMHHHDANLDNQTKNL